MLNMVLPPPCFTVEMEWISGSLTLIVCKFHAKNANMGEHE